MKIKAKYTDHKTHPVILWHPSGSGESFEELTVEEAKTLRRQLSRAITKAESPGFDYECLMCDPPVKFNTSRENGKDRFHMTQEHGRTLKWSLETGRARRIAE